MAFGNTMYRVFMIYGQNFLNGTQPFCSRRFASSHAVYSLFFTIVMLLTRTIRHTHIKFTKRPLCAWGMLRVLYSIVLSESLT